MARRAKAHDEELPFVALMDTMTNVVGVLIIVLVMIGIGLAKTVKKILSELPDVTVEEHAKLKEELKQFESKKDPQEVAAQTQKLQEELQKILESLKELEKEKEKNPNIMVDLQKLLQELQIAQKERDERKLTVDGLLSAIDKLKAQIDSTPEVKAPPPVVVKLPNTRPMPEKAEIHPVLIADGRISFIQMDGYYDLVEKTIKEGSPDFVLRRETLKGADGKPLTRKEKSGAMSVVKKTVCDSTRLAKYFSAPQFENRDVKIEVAQVPNSATIQLKVNPKDTGGETIDRAAQMRSAFRTQLETLKNDPNSVVRFQVLKDSIPTYLLAREIADKIGVPVTWDLIDKVPNYSKNLPADYVVEYTPPPPDPNAPKPPPPPPMPPKPAGPPPVVIAAPKATLD